MILWQEEMLNSSASRHMNHSHFFLKHLLPIFIIFNMTTDRRPMTTKKATQKNTPPVRPGAVVGYGFILPFHTVCT